MNTESQVTSIENKINGLLQEYTGYFLVEASTRPSGNFKVIVDADQGADIDHLSRINRALYKWMEENFYPNGNFSVEVSSPGLDEPLKLDRQYLKNIGRNVEVVLKSGLKREGKLLSTDEHKIVVEEVTGKGKKMELVQHTILKEEIKSTKIQIKI